MIDGKTLNDEYAKRAHIGLGPLRKMRWCYGCNAPRPRDKTRAYVGWKCKECRHASRS